MHSSQDASDIVADREREGAPQLTDGDAPPMRNVAVPGGAFAASSSSSSSGSLPGTARSGLDLHKKLRSMTALCHVCAARAAEAAMRGLKQRPAPQQPAAEPADASCDPQPHPFILLVMA